MLSQTEAHRLAGAINQLRPDWAIASLATWIRNNLTDRAYRDAAVALTWVACDPETTTPARVLENGPWWKATQAGIGTTSTITTRCPEHPLAAAWSCAECIDRAAPPHPSMAEARKALTHRTRSNTQPKPPPQADLEATRARADHDQEQTS